LSITLSQLTLVALAVWVVIARRAGRLAALQMPLLGPLGAFAAWSVVAALGSARRLDSFAACKQPAQPRRTGPARQRTVGRHIRAAFRDVVRARAQRRGAHRARAGGGVSGAGGHRPCEHPGRQIPAQVQ